MKCERCKGEFPEIEGLKYCPFCNKRIGAIPRSKKYYEYAREHQIMVENSELYCSDIESLAAGIARRHFNIKHERSKTSNRLTTTRIDQCGNEVIEFWHNLCASMINALKNELNGA